MEIRSDNMALLLLLLLLLFVPFTTTRNLELVIGRLIFVCLKGDDKNATELTSYSRNPFGSTCSGGGPTCRRWSGLPDKKCPCTYRPSNIYILKGTILYDT